MGLFSRKPSKSEAYAIQSGVNQVKALYKSLYSVATVELYADGREELMKTLALLSGYEKKFPQVFLRGQRPADILQQIENERIVCEHKLIDRVMKRIERLLLEYKTPRGKQNNFDKEMELTLHYSGALLPETLNYLNAKAAKMFPDYMGGSSC